MLCWVPLTFTVLLQYPHQATEL